MNNNRSQSPSINMISEEAEIKGEVNTDNDIRVAGFIDGELITKGKIIITSSGKIDGNIDASHADIAGTIEGEVRVSDKLILRESAVVTGNIFTKVILVEEGAKIDGSLKMNSDAQSAQAPNEKKSSSAKKEKAEDKSS